VTCEFLSDNRVLTVLGHSSEHSTVVDSFQEPGSYDQTIEYNAKLPQIEALLNRSRECYQRLTYSCRSARLFNSPCKPLTTCLFSFFYIYLLYLKNTSDKRLRKIIFKYFFFQSLFPSHNLSLLLQNLQLMSKALDHLVGGCHDKIK
jgi:hypothetical protein